MSERVRRALESVVFLTVLAVFTYVDGMRGLVMGAGALLVAIRAVEGVRRC